MPEDHKARSLRRVDKGHAAGGKLIDAAQRFREIMEPIHGLCQRIIPLIENNRQGETLSTLPALVQHVGPLAVRALEGTPVDPGVLRICSRAYTDLSRSLSYVISTECESTHVTGILLQTMNNGYAIGVVTGTREENMQRAKVTHAPLQQHFDLETDPVPISTWKAILSTLVHALVHFGHTAATAAVQQEAVGQLLQSSTAPIDTGLAIINTACTSNGIQHGDLPSEGDIKPLQTYVEAFERRAIIAAIDIFQGKKHELAAKLGVHRMTLLKKLKKYDLEEYLNERLQDP